MLCSLYAPRHLQGGSAHECFKRSEKSWYENPALFNPVFSKIYHCGNSSLFVSHEFFFIFPPISIMGDNLWETLGGRNYMWKIANHSELVSHLKKGSKEHPPSRLLWRLEAVHTKCLAQGLAHSGPSVSWSYCDLGRHPDSENDTEGCSY